MAAYDNGIMVLGRNKRVGEVDGAGGSVKTFEPHLVSTLSGGDLALWTLNLDVPYWHPVHTGIVTFHGD